MDNTRHETDEYLLSCSDGTYIRLYKNELTSCADAVLIVQGNGMAPLYRDKDAVLIQFCEELCAGEVGIFRFPDMGAIIRYKGEKGLYRIDPEADHRFMSETGGMVIARVLGRITPDMIPE